MKKVAGLILTIVLTAAMSFAQSGTPSSKATAAYNTAVGCAVASQTTIGATLPQSCHDIFSGASVDVTPDNFAPLCPAPSKCRTANRYS
jgi:hypothetical protein